MNRCKKILFLLSFWGMAFVSFSEDYALLLELRNGDPALARENVDLAMQWLKFCSAMGTSGKNMVLLSAERTKDGSIVRADAENVQKVCAELAKKLTPEDTLRVLITGYASPGRGRVMLSTAGGRMDAARLADFLNEIPAGKEYFLFTANAFALANVLHGSERLLVSPTDSVNQVNPPRLGPYLMRELNSAVSRPPSDLKKFNMSYPDFLRTASSALRADLAKHSLKISENSFLFLNGKGIPHPFDGAGNTEVLSAVPVPENASRKPEETPPQSSSPVSGNKLLPPSDTVKKQFTDFRAAAGKFPDSSVAAVRIDDFFQIQSDRNHFCERNVVFYIRSASGVMNALRELAWNPDSMRVRILYPDGSSRELQNRNDFISLPFVRDDSVLLLSFRASVKDTQLSEFDRKVVFAASSFPILSASVRVRMPAGMPFRSRIVNYPGAKEMRSLPETGGFVEYGMTVNDLPARIPLAGDPPPDFTVPYLLMTTRPDWSSFADWIFRMMKRSSVLTDEDRTFAEHLICPSGGKTPESEIEILRRLYEGVQNFRYVSFSGGAAAFRPQTVSEIRERGYADCKDKANMLVLLAELYGIRGYRALVNRGGDTLEDIPAWQFNHMIAFFPEIEFRGRKGLWLDPTDGSAPFGCLPPGDPERTAMLLTGETGEKSFRFVKTPRPLPAENAFRVFCNFGKQNPVLDFEFSGSFFHRESPYFLRAEDRARRVRAEKLLDDLLPGAELRDFTVSAPGPDSFRVRMNLASAGLAHVKRLRAVPPDLIRHFAFRERPDGLLLNGGIPFLVEIQIRCPPAGLSLPEKNVDSESAALRCSRRSEEGTEIRTLQLEFRKAALSGTEYPIVRAFFREAGLGD